MYNKMTSFFLKQAAKFLGGISSADIAQISTLVFEVAQDATLKGWQKAEKVALEAAELIGGEKASWVVKTVVQVVYAICKIQKPTL